MMEFIGYARKFVVALTAALGVLAVVAVDGVSPQEWIQVGIAFLGAMGVYAIKNEPAR